MCIDCFTFENSNLVFCIRDTANQERFGTLTSAYYRGAMVSRSYVILLYIDRLRLFNCYTQSGNIQLYNKS